MEIKKGSQKTDDVLQAVIITDSFDFKFRPITLEKPRVLLPIVNRCMIDYTLDILYDSGVRQAFVIARDHGEKIQRHILESSYCTDGKILIQVMVLNQYDCLNIGDALRELNRDFKSSFRGDFLLVNGFLVGKTNLKFLHEKHLRRKEEDDKILMTSVFTQYPEGHRNRESHSDLLIVGNPKNNEILHVNQQILSSFSVPLQSIVSHNCMDIRYDLNFVGIYFVDVKVLDLFTDNFDFQTMFDLIKYVIGDDLLEKKICYDVIGYGYVGAVADLKLYHSISLDIVRRWTYPRVPEQNGYSLLSNNIYLGQNVDLSPLACIKSLVVIGNNTTVGKLSKIDYSVIGNNCKIGNNVLITNSFLWDNVTVEDFCTIDNSIICNMSNVLFKTEIKKGCILSYGVTVGPEIVLPKLTFVHVPETQTDNFCSLTIIDLGDRSKGCVYRVNECDINMYLWGTLGACKKKKDEPASDFDSPEETDSEEEVARVSELDKIHAFYFEVYDVINAGVHENIPFENIVTEINVAKHTLNVGLDDLYATVMDVFVDHLFPDITYSKADIAKNIEKNAKLCVPFFSRYFSSGALLLACVNRIERHMFKHARELLPLYPNFLYHMFLNGLVDENFLSSWCSAETGESLSLEDMSVRRRHVTSFLERLKEVETDDDDEDDDDDDDEEGDVEKRQLG